MSQRQEMCFRLTFSGHHLPVALYSLQFSLATETFGKTKRPKYVEGVQLCLSTQIMDVHRGNAWPRLFIAYGHVDWDGWRLWFKSSAKVSHVTFWTIQVSVFTTDTSRSHAREHCRCRVAFLILSVEVTGHAWKFIPLSKNNQLCYSKICKILLFWGNHQSIPILQAFFRAETNIDSRWIKLKPKIMVCTSRISQIPYQLQEKCR